MSVHDALKTIRRDPQDSSGWTIFYVYMHQHLLAYVSGLLVTFGILEGEQAEDIVQDVLLTFLEKWPRLRSRISSLSEVEAYLKASCRNLLVDRYRHSKTVQHFVDFVSTRFSDAFRGEHEMYRKMFVEQIISLLPPACAMILTAYVEEDLTPAELAERENESPATFYSRWYRCIEKAKQILGTQNTT
jgi:RNA polymerase sigma factor (sigma-70 family)